MKYILKYPTDYEVLCKKAKDVAKINDRIRVQINDMVETMYDGKGIGLAANQIGVLKRLVVIDIGEGLVCLVNPVITERKGEQIGEECCLSLPDVWGIVKRPDKITVLAQNEMGEKVELKSDGLFSRVLCHEIDHLDGILFTDRADLETLVRRIKKNTRRIAY